MGSGLILLIIVGAWLAVLVPMALRSHEASNALGTVDRFHDAMRVLSRRDGVARAARRGGRPPVDDEPASPTRMAEALPHERSRAIRSRADARLGEPVAGTVDGAPARTDGEPLHVTGTGTGGPGAARAATRTIRISGNGDAEQGRLARRAVTMPTVPFLGGAQARRGAHLTPAARRRRALLVLCALVLLTLAGALAGPAWLLVPHLIADVLLVAFLVWLQRTASARRQRLRAAASHDSAAEAEVAAPAPARLVPPRHVAGIPDRMPSRSLIDGRHVVVPAARTESVPAAVDGAGAPARGAQGEPWQPVPVPVPTYVNAPTAPHISLETTRAHARAQAEHSLGTADESPGLDDLLERRRAVGD